MRWVLVGAAAAVGLFPAMAFAAVSINIEDVLPVFPSSVGEQTVFVEVYGLDTTNENERLNHYRIVVNAPDFPTPFVGVRFRVPASATFGVSGRPVNHPYVFGALGTIPPIEKFNSVPNRVEFGADVIEPTDEVDVAPGRNGFFRMPITVPAGTRPGVYRLEVDIAQSQLTGVNGPIEVTLGQQGVLVIVPEPASLGVIALGGLLALRRRHVA